MRSHPKRQPAPFARRHSGRQIMEEERRASTPVLPPLSPALADTQPPPAAQRAALRAQQRHAARQARRQQNPREGPRREAFLGNLLNEDLQHLSKWHGSRPPHEQKRFLRSVDNLYKAFVSAEGGGGLPALQAQVEAQAKAKQEEKAAAMAAVMAAAAQDDPYNRPPTPTRAQQQLAASSSAPSLPSRPIDVFEQKKRKGTGRRSLSGSQSGSSIASSDMNGLERWMDAQSMSSSTTGAASSAQFTTLSQMTRTSSGGISLCSEPGTTNMMLYRHHKRALAANSRRDAVDHHAPGYLKDGIPTIGFPESERMQTAFRDAYGVKPLAEHITKEMYSNVFKGDMEPFVEKFVETAPKEHRDQFANMVRSLQYLRTVKKRNTTTLQRQELDLQENSRLWKPAATKPMFTPEQRNLSKIPLGTIANASENVRAPSPSPPPSSSDQRVRSPAVSDLCSLPLTPHSLPTPLVAGRDLPLASAPLETIAEHPQVLVT